jgi:GNAT superfamily N-acetyltransferase
MTDEPEPALSPRAREAGLRRPVESDHPRIARLVDEWFAGRRVRHLVGRAWFRHFTGTSWLAEDASGAPAGFLIGYVSPARPEEAVLHLVAVDPNHRRTGVGRSLAEAFLADAAAHGTVRVIAAAWPGEPIPVAFFRALDFRPYDGPGSQKLYGMPALPDYDGEGEDRILFERPTSPASPAQRGPGAPRV